MSSQLVSIVPLPPLTDQVFVFNQEHFQEICVHHEKDLAFLSSEPVRAVVQVTGKVGGTATTITSKIGDVAKGGATKIFDTAGHITNKLPGSSLINKFEKGILKGIDKTEHAAEHLVDPTRVVREHVVYSNDVRDNIPDVIKAVDKHIHDFAIQIGSQCQELYENVSTKGLQIITGLDDHLVEVCNGLSQMNEILTKNQLEENLKVGKDKYRGVRLRGKLSNSLVEISDLLPQVKKSINDVKVAFETIHANLKLAKEKIESGITDPNQIFAEKHEAVVEAWKAFEVKRKSMEKLPYNH